MNLYPTIDEFACPHYKCKDCKYFKFAGPGGGCDHRFNHDKMEYARPWFDNVPEENGYPCSDFEPDDMYPAALPYWHGYKHWREWMNRQNEEEWAEAGRVYKRIDDNEELIGFRLKQAPHEFYFVKLKDYIDGTMFDGNKLKAVKHHYYKRTKDAWGYKMIREDVDGVVIEV